MSELTCPKCLAEMRSYERSGVHVDQCTQCRGVFLDRGELERLVDAESTFYQAAPRHDDRPRPDDRPRYDERKHHDEHKLYDDRKHYDDRGHRPHKRESFLSDLFD
jgi:Zn-finger nucleic acid-binding protein